MNEVHIELGEITPEARSLLAAGTFDFISQLMADPETKALLDARVADLRKKGA